jgi:uncharacterized protein YciI
MHYLLEYQVAADYLERRAAFREAHLAAARAAVVRGELVLGGAAGDPVDGATLVFEGTSDAAAKAFASVDPYVVNGLVTSYRVRPWSTVVGASASTLLAGEAPPTDATLATASALVAFLRGAHHGVVSSIAEDGRPQSATVGLAVTGALELVFDTLGATRKATNLRRDRRASVVLTRGAATAQIEGDADEPAGTERERLKLAYFEAFPDGRERAAWPGLTYFRIRPTWLRTTDFSRDPPAVVELDRDALARLLDGR